jgi:hypothetical protein
MAIFLNNGVVVKVATVDLSSYVESVTLNRQFDELENTAMGGTGHSFQKGLEASSVTINFYNDTAAAKVLQTLQAQWGLSAAVSVQQTSAANSAANPLYTMNCLINKTTDVNGKVSDLGMQSVTWNVNGVITLTLV